MQFQGPTSRSESWRWLNHHLATLSSYYLLFPLSAICSAFLPFAFTAFLDNSQSNRLPRDEALIDRKIVPDNVPTTGTAPSVASPALRLRYPSLSVVSLLKSDCLILKVIHLARKASERARISVFCFLPFSVSFFLSWGTGGDGWLYERHGTNDFTIFHDPSPQRRRRLFYCRNFYSILFLGGCIYHPPFFTYEVCPYVWVVIES